jgi:hypothetical protein
MQCKECTWYDNPIACANKCDDGTCPAEVERNQGAVVPTFTEGRTIIRGDVTLQLLTRGELEAQEVMDPDPTIVGELQVMFPCGELQICVKETGHIIIHAPEELRAEVTALNCVEVRVVEG